MIFYIILVHFFFIIIGPLQSTKDLNFPIRIGTKLYLDIRILTNIMPSLVKMIIEHGNNEILFNQFRKQNEYVTFHVNTKIY